MGPVEFTDADLIALKELLLRHSGRRRPGFVISSSSFLFSGLESASYAFFLKMMPGVEKKHRRLVSRDSPMAGKSVR